MGIEILKRQRTHSFLESLLTTCSRKKENTLILTHSKSHDPPAPDCLLVQMTIFHLQIR